MNWNLKSFVARRRALRLGFVPLTDCAPIAMAQELGLFRKYGLNVTLHRELGWASVRDKIVTGELDAAQAVVGMPFGLALGRGVPQCDCVTGLILSLHGNAITLSNELWQQGVRDGDTLRRFAQRVRPERRLTFGVVFPLASHHFLLRDWLRSAGLDPDRDVRIVVVPPAQMPEVLNAGHIDGFCVGEPWNTVAVQSRMGWCAATSAELMPSHPEKLLLVRREFAEQCAGEHEALIAALLDACEFCDEPGNRAAVAGVLARREFLGLAPAALYPALTGDFDFGPGQIRHVENFLLFHRHDANEPSASKAGWVTQHLRAANLFTAAELAPSLARTIFRCDIYDRACALRSSTLKTHDLETTEPQTVLA
jgi:ABC-type nitrate/sulfonate/bicarbonate transport system substrate-binding protein